MSKKIGISILFSAVMGTVFLYNACGSSNSNSSSAVGTAAVSGIDMSGTYEFINVSCDNGTSIVQQGIYNQVYYDTWTISGNTATGNTSEGGCVVTTSGNFVFNSNNMLNMTGMKVTSAYGGNCQTTQTLNNANIAPTSITTTFSTGQTLPDKIGVNYAYSPTTKLIALSSVYSTAGAPCFLMYQKQ